MRKKVWIGNFIVATLVFSSFVHAAVPGLLHYQGKLSDGAGLPVTGTKSMVFSLYSSATDTLVPALWTETQDVAVSNGVFNALLGSSAALPTTVFDNSEVWLGVKIGDDAEMTPRQQITSVGYAMRAGTADSVTSFPTITATSQIISSVQTGTAPFLVNSTTMVPSLNADMLDGSHASSFWQIGGNAGTTAGTNFIGTTDNQAFEVKVNGSRVLRMEPDAASPNVIGGWGANSVTAGVYGATIAGGGDSGLENKVTDRFGTVGGGRNNTAGNATGTITDASAATVSGGWSNAAHGMVATVGGGYNNTASGNYSMVGGGYNNVASDMSTMVGGGYNNSAVGQYAMVGGGYSNFAGGNYASVGGGYSNAAMGQYAMASGGYSNFAGGDYSFAAGRRAKVRNAVTVGDADGDEGTFVWADSQDADFVSTGPKQFLVRASGGVGINTNAPVPGTLDVNGMVVIEQKNFGGNAGLLVRGGTPGSNYPNIGFSTENTNAATIYVAGLGANLVNNTAGQEAADLIFNTATNGASAERMRITSTGNVGIGTTAPARLLHIAHPTAAEMNLQVTGGLADWKNWNILVDGGPGAKQNLTFRILNDAGTFESKKTLVLWNDGSATLAGYLAENSDIRLKTDIQPLESSLDRVLRLRGVSYRMKDDETNTRRIGVIAQEIEAEYPELVLTDDKGMKSVAYANLTPVLIEAVKEQERVIEQQVAKISEQKAKIDDLEARLAAIEARLGK